MTYHFGLLKMSALRPNAAKWCQTATAAPNAVKWQVCNLNLKKVHLIYILSRLLDEFYHCPVPTFFVLTCAFFCIFVVGLRSRDDNKKCSLYFNLFTLFFISGFCTLMFVGWILKKEKCNLKNLLLICTSFSLWQDAL